MNVERAAKIAANRLGIPVEDYEKRRAAGEKWCSGCQEWHLLVAFNVDKSKRDGLTRQCRVAQKAYMRAYLSQGICAECRQICYGWGDRGLCRACYQARAARRADKRETLAPYHRLAWSVVVAARLQRRWQQRARRLFVGLAKLAAKLQREREIAARRLFVGLAKLAAKLQRAKQAQAQKERKTAERERKRALKAARWYRNKPNPLRPFSLDAPVGGEDGGLDWYDRRQLPSMLSAADELLRDESVLTLRQIVGDMTPEDVARMRAWDLDRLRERLAAAGFAPEGVQESERDRLRLPAKHTNVGKAPLNPGRKKRRQKIEHKAANRARGNSNRPSQKPRKRWTREDSKEWIA